MTTRRLAAILAADVVGFSRMMSLDEEGTLARLTTLRANLFDPRVVEAGGRTIKLMGDGALCEFPSAVTAVQCATAIQRALADDNSALSEDQRIDLRLGVNVGDVIVQGDDLYGTGVNIAARLESIAHPGEVLISDAVFQQVKGTEGLRFSDLGAQVLKNIADPVRVYRVELGQQDRTSTIDVRYLLSKPAVAVLPLTNMSGDPDQEYFSDGLTEEIITALSHWKAFPVIARNSTFTYKGRAVDVRQVSKELGARYILEGSVRKAGSQVRVSVQLLDAETGHHVWTDRLDRRLEDIFAVQDEIASQIASTVEPAIQKAEVHRTQAVRSANLTAWDLYQRGNFYTNQFTAEAAAKGRALFTQAADVDPTYAPAFAGIARSWYVEIMLGQTSDHAAAVDAALRASQRAVTLDDTDSSAHQALGVAYMWKGDHGRAIAQEVRAVHLNPSNSWARIVCGNVLDVAGRPEEGIVELHAGIRLNPLNPRMGQAMTWLAGAYLNARRYGEALAWIENTLLRDASYPLTHLFHAITQAHTGETVGARAALETCERLGPGFVKKFASWRPYRRAEDNDHMLDGLRMAGGPT